MSSASKAYHDMAKELKIKNKNLQDENETLSSANQDLLHEVRVLKNQMSSQTSLRVLEFEVQNKKLLKQNKRYRERVAQLINYIEMTDDEADRQVHKIHVILDRLLEGDSDGD